MSFDKSVRARIAGVTNQPTTTTLLPLGDSSAGTFTAIINPLRASRFWDTCQYVMTGVSVAGGAAAASWTVTLVTNAIGGYTGLPIAEVSGLARNSARNIVLTNLHNSRSSPLPTHLVLTRTAGSVGIWFQLHAIAKQYRGVLSTSGSRSSERVLEGTLFNSARNLATDNLNGSDTINLSVTGASGNLGGLEKMDVWDNVLYWFVAGETVGSGTEYNATIVGAVGGTTYAVAATASTLNVAGEKLAIASNVGGFSPRPASIILTESTNGAGISSARVVFVAKSGRGSNVSRG